MDEDLTFPCRRCGEAVTEADCAPSAWRATVDTSGSCRVICRPCASAYWMHRYRTNAKYREATRRRAKRNAKPYTPKGRTIACISCGSMFRRTSGRNTCSNACRDEARRERYRRKNRRRRLRSTPGAYTLHELAERDGRRCHICGCKVDMRRSGMHDRGPTVDHLVPISDGGKDELANVALAHRGCNVRRGAGGEVQLRLVG